MEKYDVSEKIFEIDKKIDELNDKIYDLEREKRELENINKQYFVGMTTTDMYGSDYWDEFFYPLGFITEAEAIEWVDKHEEHEYCPPRYYEVAKDEYDAICLCARVNKAWDAVSYSDMICAERVIELLSAEKKRLLKKISIIEHPSYQHICYEDC